MKIEVRNVTKKFKDNIVLDNVNLTFESGHIYGLMGRNGSGKSVLLKLLCGFYKPDKGQILFDNIDLKEKNMFAPNTRALIEQPFFISELTGFENLKLLKEIQNIITDEDIIKTLEDVNLKEEMNKKYHKYSLGMKQKLGIAQVLMESPDVIILDEPLNGIEEESSIKIKNILKEKQKEGKIVIIASHIKEDITFLADKIYKFEKGNVTEENS